MSDFGANTESCELKSEGETDGSRHSTEETERRSKILFNSYRGKHDSIHYKLDSEEEYEIADTRPNLGKLPQIYTDEGKLESTLSLF